MERKQFKGPDLQAKRKREMPPDFLSHPKKDLHGFFARLKQQHPQLVKYSNREIAGWINQYNEALADQVVKDSWNGVMLPEDLGHVIVSACKVPEETALRNIDFNASKHYGVVLHHGNIHSNGYVAKINYFNDIPWHRFKNHHLWTFKPCRKLQRAVAAEFKKGKKNWYRIFTKWSRISYLFHKRKPPKPSWRELKAEKERNKIMDGYNELDFT
jgi:hypothetical protein